MGGANGLSVRTYRVSSNVSVHECVCVIGGCGRTYKGEVERSACTCSNVNDTFERIVHNFFFFFGYLQK
jgi:hypothetical protein